MSSAVVLPSLSIPVIGIGAGPGDGQVLVLHDLLGITEGRTASFVKRYAQIGDDSAAGVRPMPTTCAAAGSRGPSTATRPIPSPSTRHATSSPASSPMRRDAGTALLD